MSNVIPFSKKKSKYDGIPTGLRWAIPIHEAVSRPEVKRTGKLLEVLVDQRLKREEQEKRKMTISLEPEVFSDTSS